MQQKKLPIWLPMALSGAVIIGIVIGYLLNASQNGGSFLKANRKGNVVSEVYSLIQNKYVDSLQLDSINIAVLQSMLQELDPHSIYISKEDLQNINEGMEGSFFGLGVMYEIIDDTPHIVKILPNGPAQKAGLQVGDKILKANDSIVFTGKMVNEDFVRKNMRGPEGTNIKLNFLRDGVAKQLYVKRGMIPIPSIDASYLIAPKTGYISINKFADRTYEEFMDALEPLTKQGINKLILDLRGNGGGYMHAATAIADEFLEDDKLIVYTQGNNSKRENFTCKKPGLFEKGELIVLIDETSASASEVLAGALQDWDRATILGRRSFGKGLVQQQFNLSDGGALRLTVARYFTPLGRNIQKPYKKKHFESYEDDIYNRFENGELMNADSSKPKGQSFKTPKGKIVFGGGGITPDIFVGIDTLKFKSMKQHYKLGSSLYTYAYYHFLANKAAFANIKNTDEIKALITPQTINWNKLQSIAIKDSVSYNFNNEENKQLITQKLQAYLARQVLDISSYYKIMNTTDDFVLKAIEQMRK